MKEYSKKSNLKISTIPNGVILPRKETKDGPMWGLGGVCDEDGNFVETSFYDGGWATHGGKYDWDISEEVYQDDTVVYMGMFFQHWGHFLVDLVGRLWYTLCPEFQCENMKIAYLGELEPNGNFLEFFRLLGVTEERLIHIKRPTRFKKVIVPDNSSKSCEWYSQEYVDMFKTIVENALKNIGINRFEDVKNVYFTRMNFRKAKDTEFGEKLIGQCMEAAHNKLVAPEQLTLSEQIYIWNYAEKIICINGTIPLNLMFCQNKNLKLVVLNKTSIEHENLLFFSEMKNKKVEFINIYREPFQNYPKSLGGGPFLLTVTEELRLYLRENGIRCPVSSLELKWNDICNIIKYCFCITGIKSKIHLWLSNTVPQNWKNTARKMLEKVK